MAQAEKRTKTTSDDRRQQLVDTRFFPRVVYTADASKRVTELYKHAVIEDRPEYISLDNQSHGEGLRCSMVFDIDAGNAPLAWIDAGLPMPSWFAGSWKNGQLDRPHAVIRLSIPVRRDNAKGMKLYRAVYAEIASRLRAEGCTVDGQHKLVTKNPDSPVWDVVKGHDRTWTLYELAAWLKLDVAEAKGSKTFVRTATIDHDYASHGRNCYMFEHVRVLAYAYKRTAKSLSDLSMYVREQCNIVNKDSGEPLPESELDDTAKSISRWTWEFYSSSYESENRGAARDMMQPGMGEKKAKAVGAIYTNAKRSETTLERIQAARRDNPALTKKGASRELKIGLNTVRKYWDVEDVSDLQSVQDAKKLKAGVYVITPVDRKPSDVAQGGGESAAIRKPALSDEHSPHRQRVSTYELLDPEDADPDSRILIDVDDWRSKQFRSVVAPYDPDAWTPLESVSDGAQDMVDVIPW